LEFHHREDLPQPPSLVATVLSRSTFDLAEVSLSHLPVIALIEFAFQCLSPEDIKNMFAHMACPYRTAEGMYLMC
ncbi:MAG: hypothetical protein ACI4F2_02885, partial [Acutalibacteraceae bacterium]